MLRRIAIALLWAAGCYIAGAFAGGWLISTFSTNTHDRAVEAAMTGAFFFGPVAALIGFAIGFARSGTVKR